MLPYRAMLQDELAQTRLVVQRSEIRVQGVQEEICPAIEWPKKRESSYRCPGYPLMLLRSVEQEELSGRSHSRRTVDVKTGPEIGPEWLGRRCLGVQLD